MIPVSGYSGKKVAILGFGRSGLTCAEALREGGAEVVVWDDNELGRVLAESQDFTLADLTKERSFEGVTSLIVSPGIPHLYPAPHNAVSVAMSLGIPVDNDIGLFFSSLGRADWDRYDVIPRTVAVTGSNGKSTTSALIHHIMAAVHRPSQLGGNIGRGVLDLDPPEDGGVVVVELSSYQTELARSMTPDIAVFTNLSPDHLDRHGGMGGYFAAKKRLFSEGGPDRAIIGVDEPEGQFLANSLTTGPGDDRVVQISTKRKIAGPGWSVVARKGFLAEWRKGRQVASIDLRNFAGLPGAHNHQNACAAYAVARTLGLAPRVIEDALKTFTGLPHRSQIVCEINGVKFVNDSKATNVDAAARALAAFKNVHWIAGGKPKDGGYKGLVGALDAVKHCYLIGEAASEIAQAVGAVSHTDSKTIETAVKQAYAAAQPGDTVLLAPACASFDQFKDFEARGDAFVEAVERLVP